MYYVLRALERSFSGPMDFCLWIYNSIPDWLPSSLPRWADLVAFFVFRAPLLLVAVILTPVQKKLVGVLDRHYGLHAEAVKQGVRFENKRSGSSRVVPWQSVVSLTHVAAWPEATRFVTLEETIEVTTVRDEEELTRAAFERRIPYFYERDGVVLGKMTEPGDSR